jgi:hypothetical protein
MKRQDGREAQRTQGNREKQQSSKPIPSFLKRRGENIITG